MQFPSFNNTFVISKFCLQFIPQYMLSWFWLDERWEVLFHLHHCRGNSILRQDIVVLLQKYWCGALMCVSGEFIGNRKGTWVSKKHERGKWSESSLCHWLCGSCQTPYTYEQTYCYIFCLLSFFHFLIIIIYFFFIVGRPGLTLSGLKARYLRLS